MTNPNVITAPTPSRRQKADGPNHHLWNNHGTWWLHCTIHMPDYTKWRLRKNLRTSDVHTARQLRDRFFQEDPSRMRVIPFGYENCRIARTPGSRTEWWRQKSQDTRKERTSRIP